MTRTDTNGGKIMKVYYVQERNTRRILNQQGGWSRGLTSYRLAEFESEAAATAAFPPNTQCEVIVRNKKDN